MKTSFGIPETLSTERPDKACEFLLEGRVVVIVNGSPYAIVMPVSLVDFMTSPEDNNLKTNFANFLRVVRFIGAFLTLLLPGIYFAVTSYHQEILPTELLFSILASRENVPFPVIFEILIMEFSFELIREAGLRVPSPVGPTIGIVGALIGSSCGARLALVMSPKALQICLLIILPIVAVIMIFNRGFGTEQKKAELPLKTVLIGTFFAGLTVGCYDGFFGPGTGMFLTLILSSLLHFELVKASGTTKLINFASNVGSTVMYLMAKKILFVVAVPCLICSIAGNFVGSRLAIKNGAKIIRPIIALVAIMLIIRLISDFIKM